MKREDIINMTAEEAKNFFGVETWNAMCDTKLLNGITCAIRNGQLEIYACDLWKVYNIITKRTNEKVE